MKKLVYCIYKEYKVLVRDKAALAVMFLMPMILVFVVTIIQDSTFKSVNETSVPLLFVDNDTVTTTSVVSVPVMVSKLCVPEDVTNCPVTTQDPCGIGDPEKMGFTTVVPPGGTWPLSM